MQESKTKLSVFIPVYNGQETIERALDSILLQDVDFKFEIIVIDDKSTDDTKKILQEYQRKRNNIRVFENEKNMGKGFSVIKAYKAASGDYFHVLDSDDYFISYNKLQKQVEFLDKNPDYVAVAHNSIMLYKNNTLGFVSNLLQKRSYSYEEAVTNKFYFHTSSFMYRKIAEELPDIFLLEPMRGDSGLFFFHVFNSKKKVMYFSDISSVYNFHGSGIWSGMANKEKYALTVEMYKIYLERIIIDESSMEYRFWENKLQILLQQGQYIPPKRNIKTIEEVLLNCLDNLKKVYLPTVRHEAFKGMYCLRIVDELCEACGRIILHTQNHKLSSRNYNHDKIAILVSGFSPDGGGVFKEINELVKIFLEEGKFIEIYSSKQIESDRSVIEKYFNNSRVSYFEVNEWDSLSNKIKYLINALFISSPGRIYPFISHHDVVLNSVLQRGLGGSITIDYVFDHGLSTGINNSSIDKIIIKTISQAEALKKIIPTEKFIFLPPFVDDAYNQNPFQPLKNGMITTASASARQYKIDSNYRYAFEDLIPKVLLQTQGKHIHFGPLDRQFKNSILRNIEHLSGKKENFIQFDWVDNFSESLVENGVDLFIASFPIPSARILVEVMMAGIPIIYHTSEDALMTQSGDFCDKNQFCWKTPDELLSIVSQITEHELISKSKSSRLYYEMNNCREQARKRIIEEPNQKVEVYNTQRIEIIDLSETEFFKYDNSLFTNREKQNNRDNSSYVNGEKSAFIRRLRMKIKNILRRVLPTPARTFHGRIDEVINQLNELNQSMRLLQSRIDQTNESIGRIRGLLGENDIGKLTSEIMWAQIYNNTIENSDWLINKSVSPGRWAVGYPLLYVMFKVLEEEKPKRILELGLGQSTKIISQYADYMDDCVHDVVEHDEDWIAHFTKTNSLSNNTKICLLEMVSKKFENSDDNVFQYRGFRERFKNKKFDFIFVDGPIGTTLGEYSRVDLLTILPDCLSKTFIIIIDDTQRKGESHTAKHVMEILTKKEINYNSKEYYSLKHFYVISSIDHRFINSV